MKVVVAPDSFKACLSSREVGLAISQGIHDACPDADVRCVSVADGGEGTVDAVISALGGKMCSARVSDPLGRSVEAVYGIAGDTAVLEMASASGLPLLAPEERNPLLTSTYGTGELIRNALAAGCRRFLIGIGGSATNDGGTGMLEALGWRFYDAAGQLVHGCGAALEQIVRVDDTEVLPALREARFTVACDVDTPFYGPAGAAFVFAPQKGASPEMVRRLDAGLRAFASVVKTATGVSLDESVAGAGAAGGLGGAFLAFLGATLLRGVDMVLDAVGFDSLLDGADYVVTGEGRMDGQTARGKLSAGVLERAKKRGLPVFALCGAVIDRSSLEKMGFSRMIAVSDDIPLEVAMREEVAKERLRICASELFRRERKNEK